MFPANEEVKKNPTADISISEEPSNDDSLVPRLMVSSNMRDPAGFLHYNALYQRIAGKCSILVAVVVPVISGLLSGLRASGSVKTGFLRVGDVIRVALKHKSQQPVAGVQRYQPE